MTATTTTADLVTLARLAAASDGHAVAGVLARVVASPDALVDARARHTLVTPVRLALDAAKAWSAVPAGVAVALEPWRRVERPAPARLLAVQAGVTATCGERGIPDLAL